MLAVQAIKILNMIKVHGKPIRVNKASQDKKQQDVGANLFIGNLDPDVDEKVQNLHNLKILQSHMHPMQAWHAAVCWAAGSCA